MPQKLRIPFAILCTIVLTAAATTYFVSRSGPDESRELLGKAFITATEGGEVEAEGVKLEIPPDTLKEDGWAQLKRADGIGFNIHIDAKWEGEVGVTLPGDDPNAVVVHEVDGAWQVESEEPGQHSVTTTRLSFFKMVTCPFKDGRAAIFDCFRKEGVKTIKESLASQILGGITGKCFPVTFGQIPIAILADPKCSGGKVGLSDEEDAERRRLIEQERATAKPPATGGEGSGAGSGMGETGPGTGPGPQVPPPAPATAPRIHLSQGGPGPAGSWYNVSLSGFTPGSSVTLTCRDSVDPGGFWSQSFAIDGAGNAGDSTLCYSGDHPDHWVTGGGVESNHVTW